MRTQTVESSRYEDVSVRPDILSLAREQASCTKCHNVGDGERLFSGAVGSGLLAFALKRRSSASLILALAGGGLLYRAVTGHCSVYQALGIDSARSRTDNGGVRAKHGYKHESTVIINRDPDELYRHWRQLNNLPRLIAHLESISEDDAGRSHWRARGPFATHVEWDAEIHNERFGEMIAWRSLPDSDLDTAGSIHFQKTLNDRGTVVTLSVKYDPPAGKLGASIADLLGCGVEDELADALRKFKQLMEAQEIASTSGQPRGDCRG